MPTNWPNSQISAEEQNAILSGFQNGEYYGFQDQDEKREAGLILNHEKYIFKQKEDRLMYLVKVGALADINCVETQKWYSYLYTNSVT